MNLHEREVLIGDLLGYISEDLLTMAKHMPDDWDGVELRQLIADYVDSQVNFRPMNRKGRRWKSYRNELMINPNLRI